MKTGVNTSIIIDINKQRKKKNIEPLKCNCKTCLYFDGKMCKFNKSIINRKHCIKYEYSKPSLVKRQKKNKSINNEKIKQPIEMVIKKTTFKYLSEFFGVPVTRESLEITYKNYGNGYGIKRKSEEPLIITLRNIRTKKKTYYEIIE